MKGLYFNDDVEGGGGVTGVTTTTEPTSQQIQGQPESTLDISSTTGGRFKDVAEVQQFFETFDENYAEKSRYAEHIPQKDAYVNDFVKEVNSLLKSNATPEQVKMFIDLSLMDTDKMDKREAMAISMSLTDGISLKSAKTLISDSYPTFEEFLEKEGVDTEYEIEVEKAKRKYSIIEARLEKESKSAFDGIKNKRKDIYDGISSQEEVIQQQVEFQQKVTNAWQKNPDLKSAIDNTFGKLKFSHQSKDEKEYSIDIPLDEKELNTIYKDAVDFAIKNTADTTKENIDAIVKLAKETYIGRNFNKIISTIIEDNTSKVIKEITDNNSGIKIKREQGRITGEENKYGSFYR